MHGLIVNQLRAFANTRLGPDAWRSALATSGVSLPDGAVSLAESYADADVVGMVVALASLPGAAGDVSQLLRDFGEYLVPALLRVYQPLIRPEWRMLDVIENVEEHIHTAARLRDPNAGPPKLFAQRTAANVVEVVYTSPRRMCALAEGIVFGLATEYDERVSVEQTECMHRGNARCLIRVERTSG